MDELNKVAEEEGELGVPHERWGKELSGAEKALREFLNTAPKVVRRYLNRIDYNRADDETGVFPIFWSTVNIMKAAMYARMPRADVSRRYKDPQDDVGRVAGEIMERLLNIDMTLPGDAMNETLRAIIEDRLIPGMGQLWLRFEPTIVKQEMGEQPGIDEPHTNARPQPGIAADAEQSEGEHPEHEAMETEPEPELEAIVDVRIVPDYVHWSDFLWSPARNWQEVRWVARRVWMTRDELCERFGEIGKLVPLTGGASGAGSGQDGQRAAQRRSDAELGVLRNDPWQKAGVWEIWDKGERKVLWYVRGFPKLLDEMEDPHKLVGFFPCPQPLLANPTTSALVPKADYVLLRRVYQSLETISARISLLEDAIRVVGVYDKTSGELRSVLSGQAQNMMIPVDQWAAFAEKGGIKGVIDWLPLDQIVDALMQMRQAKAAGMQELYELTGISDIMRGATNPNETLGAQELKTQYAGVRLQFMQGAFAAFVQETLNIKAQMIVEHYPDEFIIQKSLIDKSLDAQHAPQAVQLLRQKWLAHFSLTVAPDSMALVNDRAEQESAQMFLAAFSTLVEKCLPLIQMSPETAPFLAQIVQATMSRYKFGKTVEGVLDNAIQKMLAQPQQPDPLVEEGKRAALDKTKSEAAKNYASAKKDDAEARGVPAKTAKDIADATTKFNAPPPQPFGDGVIPGLPQ